MHSVLASGSSQHYYYYNAYTYSIGKSMGTVHKQFMVILDDLVYRDLQNLCITNQRVEHRAFLIIYGSHM